MPMMQNEDCPNYINERLQTGYNYFNPNDPSVTEDPYSDTSNMFDTFKTDHPEYSDISSFSEMSVNDKTLCFNICGENQYVQNLGNRSQCTPCPGTNETDEIRQLREDGVLGMCREFNINEQGQQLTTPKGPEGNQYDEPNWFSRQQSFNLKRTVRNQIDWTSSDSQSLWTKYNLYGPDQTNPKMNDQQLKAMFGRRVPGEFTEDGESRIPIYVLPDKYGDPNNKQQQLRELRSQINTGRGSVVSGCDSSTGLWECNGDNYGPNDIIYEEAYDYWLSEFDRLDPTSEEDTSGVKAFSDLLSGISIDSNFESCVNEHLNTGDNDSESQQRIKSYTKITDFNNDDINYLQAKLRRIILAKESDINECMNMLNISESICTTGVSEKMLQIGHLVLSIVGANRINLTQLDIDDRYQLNRIIQKLGHLIPQAIKNIIKISKEYETRICNKPSNTTLLLERLYMDLYDNQVNVEYNIAPYFDFMSIIDSPNSMDGNIRYIKTMAPILVILYFIIKMFAPI